MYCAFSTLHCSPSPPIALLGTNNASPMAAAGMPRPLSPPPPHIIPPMIIPPMSRVAQTPKLCPSLLHLSPASLWLSAHWAPLSCRLLPPLQSSHVKELSKTHYLLQSWSTLSFPQIAGRSHDANDPAWQMLQLAFELTDHSPTAEMFPYTGNLLGEKFWEENLGVSRFVSISECFLSRCLWLASFTVVEVCDPQKLTLQNLIFNSWKFSPS